MAQGHDPLIARIRYPVDLADRREFVGQIHVVDHPGQIRQADGAKMDALVLQTNPFLKELQNESDRGVLLIAAEYLSCLLRDLMEERMIVLRERQKQDLFDQSNGPLRSFSARIKMAQALGWIGPGMSKDLNSIRKMRNDFAAHSYVNLKFSHLGQQCSEFAALVSIKGESTIQFATARGQFFFCVNALVLQLAYLRALVRETEEGFDPTLELEFSAADSEDPQDSIP